MSASDDRRELRELFQEVLDAYEREAGHRIGEDGEEKEQLSTTITDFKTRFNSLLDRVIDPQSTGKMR